MTAGQVYSHSSPFNTPPSLSRAIDTVTLSFSFLTLCWYTTCPRKSQCYSTGHTSYQDTAKQRTVVGAMAALLSANIEASCAICGAPPYPECPHEGERLQLAFDQALARWTGMQLLRYPPPPLNQTPAQHPTQPLPPGLTPHLPPSQRLGPKPIPQHSPLHLRLPPRHPPHPTHRLSLLAPLLHPLHALRRQPPAPSRPTSNPARPGPARQYPVPAGRG